MRLNKAKTLAKWLDHLILSPKSWTIFNILMVIIFSLSINSPTQAQTPGDISIEQSNICLVPIAFCGDGIVDQDGPDNDIITLQDNETCDPNNTNFLNSPACVNCHLQSSCEQVKPMETQNIQLTTTSRQLNNIQCTRPSNSLPPSPTSINLKIFAGNQAVSFTTTPPIIDNDNHTITRP